MDKPGNWREIDVLRGWAAVMMVANHSAVAWLNPEVFYRPLAYGLMFLGSFAPVGFFFVTGLGSGVRPAGRPQWLNTLHKVLLLLVADYFLRWTYPTWLGMDFLGFIALCVLTVALVQGMRAVETVALTGFFLVLALRYVLGPVVEGSLETAGFPGWLGFALGVNARPGFSYPPCPWLAYPLLGLYVGSLAKSEYAGLTRKRWVPAALGMTAVVTGGAAVWAYLHGLSFFRWGTVAAAFFVASLCWLAASLLAIWCLCRVAWLWPVGRWLSLRGITSLAVVPLHYLVIHWVGGPGSVQSTTAYVLMLMVCVIVVFVLANLLKRLAGWIQNSPHSATLGAGVYLGIIVTFLVFGLSGRIGNEARFALSVIGQLLLCLALAIPLPTLRGDSPVARPRPKGAPALEGAMRADTVK